MRSMTVIVTLEIEELHLQISARPEERAVQTFTPNGANQPFNEWMRERHIRHGLDFFHVEDPQIRLLFAMNTSNAEWPFACANSVRL